MSGWTIRSLGKLLDGVIDYRGRTPPFSSSGIPCISAANVKNGSVSVGPKFITKENYEKWTTRGFIKPGDVLLTTEAPVAEVAQVPSDQIYLITRRVMALQVNPELADETFLKYALMAQQNKDRLAIISHGATVPRLYKDEILEFELLCPPLPTQKKITAVLSAYDDLIENNSKRIALLEKAAEEIYREWFVRLRFPGWETADFHKGIPEGWETKTIGEICIKVTDGSHSSPRFQENGMYMASVKDMHANGFSLDSIKTISEQDFRKLERSDCRPLKNDILIAKDGSYLKHVFVWNDDVEVVILSSIAILRPNTRAVLPNFLALTLKQDSTKSMMSGFVSGSALPRIILKDFKKMKLLIPEIHLMSKFESMIGPIYQNVHIALKQNQLLKQTRDLLLSRLISGKLPVDKLDIQFLPSMIPTKEPLHA